VQDGACEPVCHKLVDVHVSQVSHRVLNCREQAWVLKKKRSEEIFGPSICGMCASS
jgi:hypothetical protein